MLVPIMLLLYELNEPSVNVLMRQSSLLQVGIKGKAEVQKVDIGYYSLDLEQPPKIHLSTC
jgi:hypothetical protein